jgi:hypothetical protein
MAQARASPTRGTDIDGTRRQPSLGTILVVDDDRDTADITAALLQSMGLAVMAAYSARDGLDRLDESPDICLVVSDVRCRGGRLRFHPAWSGIDSLRCPPCSRPVFPLPTKTWSRVAY